MPRSPLTEPLLRVQGMIAYVRENLSTDEYMLFLDLLVPLPEPEVAPVKKTRKKSKSSSKSPRATGIEQQLNKRREQGREAQGDITVPLTGVETQGEIGNVRASRDYESPDRCSFVRDDGKRCLLLSDHNVHHMKSAYGYHPFVSVSDAPDALAQLPANGGVGSGTASSETQPENAGSAARAIGDGN